MIEDPRIAELERRLARYPADRYPVQHATASFHLGTVLAERGRVGEASEALERAATLFEAAGMATERAKALNAIGALARDRGDTVRALELFSRAAAAFAAAGETTDEAIATHNRGLALADAGRADEALACFAAARARFTAAGLSWHAAAAAREQGTLLLARSDAAAAVEALVAARDGATAAGDALGAAAAANALGLALLALDDAAGARDAFLDALGAHPRALRPAAYAMVKANLAVAYERIGAQHRARAAARQALGTPAADALVRAHAAAVLDRLGDPAGDTVALLDDEPEDRWPAVAREELLRWIDAPPKDVTPEAAAWASRMAASDGPSVAVAWLDAALELPGDAMEAVIALLLDGAPDPTVARRMLARAATRFHVPQMMRLQAILDQARGEEP